ncbi:MAG: hypothetical protein R2817_06795 [Flavobacteriales bacterium]
MKYNLLPMVLMVVALLACRKDDVVIDQLTNNPFDVDYTGASVFEVVDTYMVTENIPGVGAISRQAIRFRVRSDRFLPEQSGLPYQVFVREIASGGAVYLDPSAPGSDVFIFLRNQVSPGIPVCLELALANNFSSARPETICVTL